MFESIVVDLLNRFLGDYVENLDRSQLKLAIWGGDITLRNLDIKQNALNDLDLPIKVCSGHLGELVLKIPWKNLYSSPVVAIIDGLYVVIAPNVAQKYNSEKEKKIAQEMKNKELERIEDAKAREAEKKKEKSDKQDTFTEKIITQIIRNLQVKIMNIHIRYEDDFTNPACSFAVGVTLHGLFFETTDESWTPCVVPVAVNMFNKLVTMDSLGIYWNSNAELFSKMNSDNRKMVMIKTIASKNHKPIDNCYILGPITLTTKMTLNPKPETDGSNFCIPKIQLNIIIEDISVLLNKLQYHQVLQLLDSVDRMAVASMYRKYRPDKPHKGNAKLWWKFAVICILEEDVRRRRRNWSWVHMQEHRKTCRKYKGLYKQKLTSKNLSQNIQQQIDDCENYLDVFNITVVRRQAELDISRNMKSNASRSGGWFSSLFSGSEKTRKVSGGVGSDIVKKFDETMTEKEKAQLCEAIGYQENSIAAEYPKTFIENKLFFQLSRFVISVRDDSKTNQDVLKVDLNNVSATFEHRPSAEAFKLGMQVKSFAVYGSVLSDGKIPHMVKVEKLNDTEDLKLLQMMFETNPLDQTCDQRINVSTMPLEIIYDSFTINNLVEVFRPPQTVSLYQLQAVAAMKLEDFKDKSALGLQHAVEQHKNLDLNVNIEPSHIIVPENGVFGKYSNILVINLGNFQMQTVRETTDLLTVKSLVKAGITEEEILETMMTKAYDKFHISLQNVGVLLTKSCNDWKKQIAQKNPKNCLLQPVSVDVNFMRAIVTDDPRMPKVKISGELPLLNVSLSDKKLKVLMSLLQSIPFPESEPEVESKKVPVFLAATETVHIQAKTLKQVTGPESFVIYENFSAGEENESEIGKKELVQFIDLHLNFEIKRIVIDLSHQVDGIEKQMISFRLFTLGISVFMRTFDMSVDLLLGGISLEHKEYFTPDEQDLYLLNTPATSSGSENLFTLQYLQAYKKGPLFDTHYKSTIQSIFIRFTQLDIVLHRDALLGLIKFASDLTSEMQNLRLMDKVVENRTCSQELSEGPTPIIEEKTRPLKRNLKDDDVINLQINAKLSSLGISICTNKFNITNMQIRGMDAQLTLMNSKTMLTSCLKEVLVVDSCLNAVYPNILSTTSEEVLRVEVVTFDKATEDEKYLDMSAVDLKLKVSLGAMKLVFLSRYISKLLNFISEFETAKEKIAEASVAAVEVAKHGMEEAYRKATRVSLDVHIKAPVILIPQNFHSETVLIADLGTLKLFNTFEMLNINSDSGIPAIFDNLCLEFSDLKLSTAVVNTVSGIILAESLLLEPINLNIEVVRNLSIGWYREVPEIAVKGNLAAVRVVLSQEDITIIMKLLVENLGDAEPNISSSENSVKVVVVEKHITGEEIPIKEHIEEKEKGSELIESVFKRMTFDFQLDSFKTCLYKGSSNLSSGLSERKPECALAQFELVTIAIKGEILSDSSLLVNVILVNCILVDKRSTRKKGIFRLMECVSIKNDTENMIDVTFRQDSNLDRYLFTKISSFILVLNVDYLMMLGDFFVKAMPENLSQQPATAAVPETPDVTDHANAGPFGCTSINLDIKEQDLILIEDMEDINSNAVILKFKMDAKILLSPNSQSVSGVISHLQLFTACFNPELRANTMSEILKPCDIALYSCSPNMKGQHVDINFTSIFLNVSPNTIFIFMNILSSLASQKSSKQLEETKSSEEYSKLWIPKKLEECSFWFLKNIGFAEEAVEDVNVHTEDNEQMKADSELFMLNMNTIILTIESGVGKQTVPMVLMEASFQAQAQNWSSNLHLKSVFSMEAAYFNEKLAMWEPLAEPVENSGRSKPWELLMEITNNSELPEACTEDEESLEISFQPPVMCVSICSNDVLELMVSKVALEVLTHLGYAFSEAVKQAHEHKYVQPEAPYVVKNHLGIPISVILTNNIFQVVGQDHSGFKEVILEPYSSVYLKHIASASEENRTSILIKQNVKLEEALCIKFETGMVNAVRNINISHVGKRYFQLPLKTYPDDQWGFVVDVASLLGSKVITFQSCITVRNYFANPIELYYMRPGGNELEMCGVLEPEKTFFVPIYGVYTPTSQFFFKPHEGSFSVCTEPFVWKDLMSEPSTSKILQCTGHSSENRNLFFKVIGNVEQVYFERSMKKTLLSTCYTLHLRPTASLRNLLPFTIRYTIQGVNEEFVLEEGFTHDLLSAYPGKTYLQITLPSYLERKWMCCKEINHTIDELSVWTFSTNVLSSELVLDLGMHTRKSDGYLDMEIYCPFWMINKTNLLLTYKGEQNNTNSHPGSLNAPLLFSFRAKNFFSKKKASLKVEDSEWSDEFAVDAVGSSGSIAAKVKDGKTYCLGVQIMLGQTSLHKLVVFTPFYMLMNNSKFDIQVRENLKSAQWLTILAGECAAFWPDQRKNMEMLVRFADSENHTMPFSFKEPHSSLLRLGGLKSAIYVDCQVGESSTVLTFSDYSEGSAQVRLINHTDSFSVEYFQYGKSKKEELAAQHCILYTWEDPMGKKELVWSCGNKIDMSNNLIQDGIGEFFADKDSKIYWVSFLDGLQRTLLFTEDVSVATAAQEVGELERIEQEITVSLQGVGVSLVDSERRSEIVYISLTNSGVLWEQRKLGSRRFKPVSLSENVILEEGYQKYLRETRLRRKLKSKYSLEGKLEVDFVELIMYKPKKRHIRRSFQLGLWAQYSSSPHQLQLHAKINKLQIDNQLIDCVFPVVFAPMPLPKSVAADRVPKPFTEISIMMRKAEHSSLNQFKYFKVLVQEFQVKVDQSFLNSLISFFSPKDPVHINHKELLEKDKEVIKKDLEGFAITYSSQDQKNFYDILHFSPIKVHLSFSMTGGGKHTNQPTAIQSDFINLLLHSVGVTVTEVQDVIFRLNYFERQNAFLTQRQLISDATMHYTKQALKQLYMLVLGLDVIGNPVGLLLGITEGVGDFFYEPFQGAVQGPEEFAEGLAIGVKSLLGHAVGGAAGAVSRITGTLGKGLAALTMDQEYQKKRRQQMNKQPEDVAQGLAQGGKGVIMGVFEGVTGVITKPVTGAKEEGIGGFFKGVGKGLIGVVARPTGGVIDFASSGLEAVKKVTELSDEVKRARCPRYIHPDTIIKPYHRNEAEGNLLLQETEKGRFVTTDEYVAHLPLGSEGKSYLLVTSRRVMYIIRGDVFGQCNTEWEIVWSDMRETPQIMEKGIKFMLKQPRKKKLGGLIRNEEMGKLVYISDPKLCAWIVGKVEEAMKQCM